MLHSLNTFCLIYYFQKLCKRIKWLLLTDGLSRSNNFQSISSKNVDSFLTFHRIIQWYIDLLVLHHAVTIVDSKGAVVLRLLWTILTGSGSNVNGMVKNVLSAVDLRPRGYAIWISFLIKFTSLLHAWAQFASEDKSLLPNYRGHMCHRTANTKLISWNRNGGEIRGA